ncbi:MAG: TonB-dependent receptor, partial [Candidatus Eremiobacteraeota bacterium]|nr:TonB-dependent receptor [Candidatus Eremiobacteraeota bacterium]
AYDSDIAKDILATQPDPSTGLPVNLIGVRQDRSATYTGLRLASLHVGGHHAIKFGVEGSMESFVSNARFVALGKPDLFDNVARRGSQVGAYVQDKWSPSRALTISAGLRYDHSTGFVWGNQLSPRIGVNIAPDSKNVVHFYYGRLYAAPALEDVRRSFTILAGAGDVPVYDLKPERDSYTEMGIAHTFATGFTGYLNYFRRNAINVLDTTQLLNTPLFAVFNNAVGRVEGAELRLQCSSNSGDSWFVSGTVSRAEAGGVSGSTFLFPPTDNSLQPEDHDQTYEAVGAYTHRFGASRRMFATLQTKYGTGYPVQFQSGPARLPAHIGFDVSVGRDPGRGPDRSVGFNLSIENVLGHQYPIKVTNGFNTTQISVGRKMLLRLTAPI